MLKIKKPKNETIKSLTEGEKIAGICGGLATPIETDPTIIRLTFILLMLITGIIPLIIFYLIVWWINPIEEKAS